MQPRVQNVWDKALQSSQGAYEERHTRQAQETIAHFEPVQGQYTQLVAHIQDAYLHEDLKERHSAAASYGDGLREVVGVDLDGNGTINVVGIDVSGDGTIDVSYHNTIFSLLTLAS